MRGWGIFAVALLATTGGMGAPTLPWAGALAWLLTPWLFPQLDARQKRTVGALLGIGLLLALSAAATGHSVSWAKMLTQNTLLIAMLASVTFLQLVAPAPPAVRAEARPAPPWRRLLQVVSAVHLIGAVINLSMVVITVEQLVKRSHAPLPEPMARALARGFLAAALWSPFFAAMAVAITYAPGASLAAIAQYGAPLAVVLIAVSIAEIVRRYPAEALASLPDYPLTPRQLFLPFAMATLVVVGHEWRPDWAMLSVINLAAMGLPFVVLLVRASAADWQHTLYHHIVERLPLMRGELLLFLAAGVFAVGIESWLPVIGHWLPVARFDWVVAALTLAGMIALASIGVHAVITITIVSSWFAPLAPDPVVLALMFLGTWALGLAVNPLSGVHLLLEARFGLSAVQLARGNWRYAMIGYALVVAAIAVRQSQALALAIS
jgi:hypothetical protein